MTPAPPRKIIHCDCDCFYAAVETRDDPRLAGRPLAVGGRPEQRGVVATCNYEARAFGIRSAMAMAQALRRCPELVVLSPDFPRYRRVAEQIRAIFLDYTPRVEPLSLDEAYLDVTASEHQGGSATRIASEIRARVRAEVGITVSAGVAPNKFLAKIASEWRKPDGLFVIAPGQVDDFVRELEVRRLPGVGVATAARLDELGVTRCAQLRELSLAQLTEHFGVFGQRLHELCRGIDERAVEPDRRRKSLSVETTFARDLPGLDACLRALDTLHAEFIGRLRRLDASYRVEAGFVKLRFDDFTATTLERRDFVDAGHAGYRALCALAWRRRARPVRLLGLGVRLTDAAAPSQRDLFAGSAADAARPVPGARR
ncbi:MAG: DNA polymerase IV [Porticoccaceae bacterium]